MRLRVNIMRQALPKQREYDAGYREGRSTYSRFEHARDFADLKDPPTQAWLAGYVQGYRNAERGRA